MLKTDDKFYKAIDTVVDEIKKKFDSKGIRCKIYQTRGPDTENPVDEIAASDHDLSILVTFDNNSIAVDTSSSKIHPVYEGIRSRLNVLAAEKKILIITTKLNDELDGLPTPNISRIWFPFGGMMMDIDAYKNIDPVRIKNFGSTKHWISLNRCHNHHRVMMAMLLLGHDLGLSLDEKKNTGNLRISPEPVEKIQSWQEFYQKENCELPPITEHQDRILTRGFKKLKNGINGGQPDGNVITKLMYNPVNFDQRLRYLYQDSLIEFVNGTTYYNPAGYPYCEKPLNSILGMNFPLFVGNAGMARGIRLMGFDIFDDIFNHGYDSITDPIQRMFTLVESNLELLKNRDLAQACWIKCVPRLLKNVQVAREMLPRSLAMIMPELDRYIEKNF